MDWFEQLTGFCEGSYAETRSKLAVNGDRLTSLVSGKSYGIGELDLAPLHVLRARGLASGGASAGRLRVTLVRGDVREMHRSSEYAGALFQVASQFNLLEMVGPDVTPEHGVTRYEHDPTQGPACAIAAGAATVYRNYFAPIDGGRGQTADRQCGLNARERESLRGLLRIGLHWDVEVTEAAGEKRPLVSQAFCSALPVAYTRVPAPFWKPFASLVLEAAYEATMWAAVLNARRGASNIVILTSLGGGAFGNDESWIEAAIRRALKMTSAFDLDVRLVSHRAPSGSMEQLVREFGGTG